MRFIKTLAYVLVIIGALNWGLVGFLNFDLVATIFGEMSFMTRLIYDIVGISALIYMFTSHKCLGNDY